MRQKFKRWAIDRIHARHGQGARLALRDLMVCEHLAMLTSGNEPYRAWLRDHWRMWTATPGDRWRCFDRDVEATLLTVRGDHVVAELRTGYERYCGQSGCVERLPRDLVGDGWLAA